MISTKTLLLVSLGLWTLVLFVWFTVVSFRKKAGVAVVA